MPMSWRKRGRAVRPVADDAAGGFLNTFQKLDRGGLAGAVGAEQAKTAAGWDARSMPFTALTPRKYLIRLRVSSTAVMVAIQRTGEREPATGGSATAPSPGGEGCGGDWNGLRGLFARSLDSGSLSSSLSATSDFASDSLLSNT